jgi:protein-S-isoprenylcysteine O-methyltransferase Ste14
VQNHAKEDLFSFAIPAFVLFSAGLAVCGWDFVRRYGDDVWVPSALSLLGGVFVLAGITNNIACQITMGRSYSASLITREDHRLITHGMYAYVRHPIYLGVCFVITGIAMFTSSLLGLIVLWSTIPFILRRIRTEESMLIDEFGEEYEEYRGRTRKLVPFVY